MNKDQISQIEVAQGECNGECPYSVVRIDSNLNYYYYGGEYADKQGYYKGTISRNLWDNINVKLRQIEFEKLNTSYFNDVDHQQLEVIIAYDGRIKHIKGVDLGFPNNVMKTFYQIADTYKTVTLKPVKDSIKFNTQLQYPTKAVKPLFPPPYRPENN